MRNYEACVFHAGLRVGPDRSVYVQRRRVKGHVRGVVLRKIPIIEFDFQWSFLSALQIPRQCRFNKVNNIKGRVASRAPEHRADLPRAARWFPHCDILRSDRWPFRSIPSCFAIVTFEASAVSNQGEISTLGARFARITLRLCFGYSRGDIPRSRAGEAEFDRLPAARSATASPRARFSARRRRRLHRAGRRGKGGDVAHRSPSSFARSASFGGRPSPRRGG